MQKYPLNYLQLLSEKYPSMQAASTAIINFSSELQLPKGTEHFLSDVHGENEAFQHIISNGAGSIWRKIDEMFANSMSRPERRNLATLVYYPEEKMPLMLQSVSDKDEWCRLTLVRLVRFSRYLSAKYRRQRIRNLLPKDVAETIEELLYDQEGVEHKSAYYQNQIDTIVSTGSSQVFITSLAFLIQKLAVERLHIIGDIYDRGPGAHIILDDLMEHHQVDIQWGNHDMLWMGSAAGSETCIANVIRISLRYGNMETLENGYGISILPLASFAIETYKDDPCAQFIPKVPIDSNFSAQEIRILAQMQKAIAVIQFKLESQVIRRHPQYQMDDRLLLQKVDYARGIITINGVEHPLLDTFFPTIDPQDPEALTPEEQAVVDRLVLSFTTSKKLQQHTRFLFSAGSLYRVHDGNLLYHGCIAMNDDGSFRAFNVDGMSFSGKAFLDRVDRLARQGYFDTDNPEQKRYGMDAMWFMWCAPMSPLFGKDRMTTFERYFIADKSTHTEKRNAYYTLRDTEESAKNILREFGLDPDTGIIINGHVPVKVVKGERPIKANGRLMVIDGGFSRAYQNQTGIAGYTLISNSRGMLLAAHQPFESKQKAVSDELDIHSETEIVHTHPFRLRVKDTDRGREIQEKIDALKELLLAYREGLIKEHSLR